jgi:anti-sigma B factor antagonist
MTVTERDRPRLAGLADDLVVDVPSGPPVPERHRSGSMRVELTRPTRYTVVVSVAGEIDMCSAPRLRELLHHRLTSCTRTVVVDVSAVTFIDSGGLSVLCGAQKHASVRLVSLRLVTGGTGRVDRLIDLLDLERNLVRYNSVPEALSS